MRNVLPTVLLALALAPGGLAAQGIPPCGKNHFILEEPVPCLATDAAIGQPRAVAADGRGNVYFSTDHAVFRIDAAGRLRRVAGDGVPGFSGDGGPATEARLDFQFHYPESTPDLGEYLEYYDPWDFVTLTGGLAVDPEGNLFIADAHNRRVRRVDRDGIITTVGEPFAGWLNGIAVDPEGALVVGEFEGPLWKLDAAGRRALLMPKCFYRAHVAGNFECYYGIAPDGRGGAFVGAYCAVEHLDADGNLTRAVGVYDRRGDPCGYAGDGGLAKNARIGNGGAVALDAAGNLYVGDVYCIRKVDATGIITTVAGVCRAWGFEGDGGPAEDALFGFPLALAVSPDGTLYAADWWNRRIRAISPDGVVRTIAGTGR